VCDGEWWMKLGRPVGVKLVMRLPQIVPLESERRNKADDCEALWQSPVLPPLGLFLGSRHCCTRLRKEPQW
jgi:hypothetical protein